MIKRRIREWAPETISLHKQAADLLAQVKDESFALIHDSPGIGELAVQGFIEKRFQDLGLVSSLGPPIVGFGAGSAIPHYFPTRSSNCRLEPGTVVLIDIWARLNKPRAPFADITWVGYCGSIPDKVQKVADTVFSARDAALAKVRARRAEGVMPTGAEVDLAARAVVVQAGYENNILHRTGHSIGFHSPHGLFKNVNTSNPDPLVPELGYTIEPGIYLPGEFGIRSEIDFYIAKDRQLVVTTPVQKELVRL